MSWKQTLIAASLLALAGTAQAVPLAEVGDAGGAIGTAQAGGTAATTSISGVLPNSDVDVYQFIIGAPIASFTVVPLSPRIAGNFSFDVFDLEILDSVGTILDSCVDCWFSFLSASINNQPAGTYYVRITDTDFLGGNSLNTHSVGVEVITKTVPEPASLALLGAGLLGLGLARRRVRRQ